MDSQAIDTSSTGATVNVLVGKGQGCSASASGRVLEVVSETDTQEAIVRS